MSRTSGTEDSFSGIQKTLAHHDGMIGNLAGRMSGVESGLNSAVSMIREMRDEMVRTRDSATAEMLRNREETNKGFESLRIDIGNMKSEQGPGIGKMLSFLVAGAALIGMAAGGITILVTSFVAPDITKLKTVGERHETYLEQNERSARDELRDLRRAHDKRIQERLERMEERLSTYSNGWATTTKPTKP